MSECASEWIGTVLKSSGETEVTKEVLLGAIEMAENSSDEIGEVKYFKLLEELEGMLHDSE